MRARGFGERRTTQDQEAMQFIHHRRSSERGYVLITLLLFVTLLAVAMVAMAPVISQQVKRDREEELIHRGVQYSRAIKHFVKKFGRYPMKIEDLENTNNIRFLRKRYKDPITGKDFKILHMGEVQMSFGGGIAGATPAANLAAASQAPGFNNPGAGSPFGAGTAGNSVFGGNSPMGGGAFGGGAFGGGNFGGGNFGGGNFGGNSLGGNTLGGGNSPNPVAPNVATPGQAPGPDTTQNDAGSNPNQQVQAAPGTVSVEQTNPNTQVFGGGPMVGVASISKDKSIRVFSKKDHYYQWQFIYDPSTDRGGLLTTPNQPGLQSFAGGMQPGVPGTPGGTQNSSFGTQSPFGSQGTQMPAGGMQPMQPQSPQPPQQQFPQMPPEQGPQ
jgi:type II secretory pathway pseudopilin PulG